MKLDFRRFSSFQMRGVGFVDNFHEFGWHSPFKETIGLILEMFCKLTCWFLTCIAQALAFSNGFP